MLHPTLPPFLCRLLIISLLALGLRAISPAQAAPGALPPLAPAAPGDLDPSFGGFGVGGHTLLGAFTMVDLVVQTDGRIVMVGTTPNPGQLAVLRYLPNGQPDPDFGGGDGAVTYFNLLTPASVAVQSDGRIVVGGSNNFAFVLARLTTSGALDTSFGEQGVFTDVDPDLDTLNAILVQPDDKIVAVGGATVNGQTNWEFGVARYGRNGGRDAAFGGGDGKLHIPFGHPGIARVVAQQNDGKLVVAGGGFLDDFQIARINLNGTLDDDTDGDGGFSVDGRVVTTIDNGVFSRLHDVALMADGRIVVVGHDRNTGASYLVRYEADGDLDATFNGQSLQPYTSDYLAGVALLPDGRVLALGTHGSDFALHRVTVDGQEDETFGFNNAVVFPDFGGVEEGRHLALLPDGRILFAGWQGTGTVLARLWPSGVALDAGGQQAYALDAGPYYPVGSHEYGRTLARLDDGRLLLAGEVYDAGGSQSHAFVTRFLPTGRVDTSFNFDGTAFVGTGTFSLARAMAVQPNGAVVIAGHTAGLGVGHDLLIARLTPDGLTDDGFGDFGNVRVDFGSGHDELYAVALTPPDPVTGQVKIVVAGVAYNGAHNIWVVMRRNADGKPDPTFGPNHDGLAVFDFGPRCGDCAAAPNAVAVQPDGSVVVAGFVDFDTAIARLTPAGLLDDSFGEKGLTIRDLGGHDGINALVLAPDGHFFGAGSHAPSGHNDFVVTHFSPGGELLDHGSADWGSGNDIALALDWRDDGQLAVGGVANSQVAWAQFSTADVSASPIQGTTDFVGSYEAATGIQFAGGEDVIVGGFHEYQGDWNMALARFKTGPYTPPPPPPPTPPPPPPPPPGYTVFLPFLTH